MNSDPNDPLWFVFAGVMLIITLMYTLPTFIAFIRNHPNKWWILLLNLALGGTGIAWLACLIWSLGQIGHKRV